jgi:type IV secretory pathway TrbL component
MSSKRQCPHCWSIIEGELVDGICPFCKTKIEKIIDNPEYKLETNSENQSDSVAKENDTTNSQISNPSDKEKEIKKMGSVETTILLVLALLFIVMLWYSPMRIFMVLGLTVLIILFVVWFWETIISIGEQMYHKWMGVAFIIAVILIVNILFYFLNK